MAERNVIGSVAIVGGGVAGIQAALDLAESGFFVYLIEKTGTIGGAMAQLDKTFPSNDCAMCTIAPRLVECGRHVNIKVMTLCELTDLAGTAGDFILAVKESPRYVDMEKCIACGLCTEKCPKSVASEYDALTGMRKAIYVSYAQAVPLKYQIDQQICLHLTGTDSCRICEKICDAGAIDFTASAKIHHLSVGAVILAPGFALFDPAMVAVWNFGVYGNVITSLQLERYLATTGPSHGKLVRPADGKAVNKIAFLQCIGSRDEGPCANSYCSSVCCMSAIKEAMITRENNPGMSSTIFYMDMRTHGKEFDRYMEQAKTLANVRFVRSRINAVEQDGLNSGDLRLRYVNEDGRQIEEYFDLVVLSVGLQISPAMVQLAEIAGIRLTADKFAATSDFMPVATSREGVFTCGAFCGPKDIPQAVIEGLAAAAAVGELLASSRHSLTKKTTFPVEQDIRGQDPRLGIFICHCGSNIARVIDVAAVAEYAKTLPNVVHVECNLFSCSQDTQDKIAKSITEHGLNRVVIAACTPRTHEPLFRKTLKTAGLNEYLVEMANIRNHSSWVHRREPEMATAKAKDLVRMATAKVSHAEPLVNVLVPVSPKALVVGGGLAGMTAALNLANHGFVVHLIECSNELGGNALHLKNTWSGEHIPGKLVKLVERILAHSRIFIHLGAKVIRVDGFVGNFSTTIKNTIGQTTLIDHGAAIIATGAALFAPTEYGYGTSRKIVTSIEFDKLHELKERHVRAGKTFVFIQCVGSRQEGAMYCSKVCCTHSVQAAIELKKEDPARHVYILYRDMRTYGQREALYRQARKMGVIFINYELHGKPEVSEHPQAIEVTVYDHVLHRPLIIRADMVILAASIRSRPDAGDLGQLFKIPVDGDGFFMEAHAKLRPVDFSTEGVFVAGLAHYPKPIEESIAQALAAAARAATLLAKSHIQLDAIQAIVDPACDGCALCVDVCPFRAISLITAVKDGVTQKTIVVNPALCKGCGLCQGTCPKDGVHIAGFSMRQISSQIQAALAV